MSATPEAVEAVARAIAKAANADYWVDEIDEWEAQDDWEKQAYEESSYPANAYEDRDDYRKQATAALEAAGHHIAEQYRAKAKALSELPNLGKTLFHMSIATLLDLADELDPTVTTEDGGPLGE